ncbi:MAG: CHAT domain-containing protein, partial [Bacteroidota bacterium]
LRTKKKKYRDLAFDFSEQSKAMILLEAVSAAKAEDIAGIPPDLLRKKERLISEMDHIRTEMRNTTATAALAALKTKLFDLQNSYSELKSTFERDYPAYYNLVYEVETALPDVVQGRMAADSCALIEYFYADTNLFIFAFTADTFLARKTRIPDAFADSLDSFSEQLHTPSISNSETMNYLKNARLAYETLLGDLNIELPEKIVVVADGPLNYISFDALVSKDPEYKDPRFHELDYLLFDHIVAYNYSATFLLGVPTVARDTMRAEVLAYAPSFEKHQGLIELAEAKAGVEALGEQYAITTRIDAAATKARFQEEAPKYGIIDLATHGTVDTANPMNSRLYFTPDGAEDSILYLSELYSMNLNARLAILEACETGTGNFQRGEGVMSMARGFTYAGCNSVLMSLWRVAEGQSTRRIMEQFYTELMNGTPVAAALARSKRALLADIREKGGAQLVNHHPFFWAELVLIGETKPIPIRLSAAAPHMDWLMLGLGLASLLLLGFGVWKWRTRRN